jgi:hypothetical protein
MKVNREETLLRMAVIEAEKKINRQIYLASPKERARRKAYDKAYQQTEKYKAAKRERDRAHKSLPEVLERARELYALKACRRKLERLKHAGH